MTDRLGNTLVVGVPLPPTKKKWITQPPEALTPEPAVVSPPENRFFVHVGFIEIGPTELSAVQNTYSAKPCGVLTTIHKNATLDISESLDVLFTGVEPSSVESYEMSSYERTSSADVSMTPKGVISTTEESITYLVLCSTSYKYQVEMFQNIRATLKLLNTRKRKFALWRVFLNGCLR